MSEGHFPAKCVFCDENIASNELDPCELHITAGIDQPRAAQKEQSFFCHMACLRSSSHPRMQNLFYIAEPDFATVGEIEEDSDSATGERLIH
jgi:hypothetical protein